MVLKFIFGLETQNGVVEKIIKRIAKALSLEAGFKRDEKYLSAYIKGSEDMLDNFSRELANQLPMSVFLKSLNAEVCEVFEDLGEKSFPDIELPPCPKCISEVKDPRNENYYNPFHRCDVCGYFVNQPLEMENWKLFFENLAAKLKKEGKIYIQTMNGKYEVSLFLGEAEEIVAVDLSAAASYFMVGEGEAKALGSIEKPLINLKTNLGFKKEFELSTPSYFVKLADCMVLELLCEEIKGDVKLLALKKTDRNDDFAFEKGKTADIPVAVVCDTKERDILIERGERGLLPKFEKNPGLKCTVFNGKYLCECESDLCTLKTSENEKYDVKKPYAGFYGVLAQHGATEQTVFGYALYEEDESKIFVNSPKFGLIEYVGFDFSFKDGAEVYAAIKASDETGAKLVNNYKTKFPEIFEKSALCDLTSSKKGMAYLWGVCAVILGFAGSVDEGYEKIISLSLSAMAKKGPRIDYKTEKNSLDPLWVIRTSMSFKLAGVDSYLLSFGIVESFAEFLTTLCEDFEKQNPVDAALMVGDLFKGELLNKTYTNISKNRRVLTPKALPISGAVEAYGGAVIKSMST